MPVYFFLHLGTIAFPLAWSWDKRVSYHSKWYALFPALIIIAFLFLVWDGIFTSLGIWGFNSDYTLGIDFFGMPVEEWLFFINMPFATLFIYECVKYYFPGVKIRNARPISILLGILLIGLGFMFMGRLYTSTTFLATGLLLVLASWKTPKWWSQFMVGYLFHLIPFFIVNGVLTGSFLENPIVWYDNSENLGIRIGTVPIEDSIYSMLLMLLNVIIYEWLLSKRQTIPKQKG
jgi:lycopene cyclase domain-containing protein